MSTPKLRTYALCSTALMALALAPAAYAQDEAAADEVVVTGSRVITNGFAQPTPVTVVTAEQLAMTAPNSLMEGLNQLPQLKNSFLAASTGFLTGGGSNGNFVNLRALGITRNLVLLNGQRIVSQGANSTSAGAVDIATFPQLLVRRVDVTTGGGSAAYGSDALSGVINFVLDTKFTGLKGEVRGGMTSRGDNESYGGSLAFGRALLDGRAHVIGSVEYFKSKGIDDFTDRSWANAGQGIVTNVSCPTPQTSTACPTRIVADAVMPSNAASGGLIIGGATGLRGQYFNTPTTLSPFPYGRNLTYPAGSPSPSQTTMVGGGLPQDQNLGRYFSAVPPQNRGSAYLRASYDLTPDWTVYASGMYSSAHTRFIGLLANDSPTIISGFTIFDDNPYLPATIRNQMLPVNPATGAANPGATSLALVNPATGALTGPTRGTFVLGRLNTDWPVSENAAKTSMQHYVFGLDGKANAFGRDWTVAAYYGHSRALRKTETEFQPVLVNLLQSIDAVASPGGAGLAPAGTPICRSTITTPTNGCVPINPFGATGLSPAQQSWFFGGSANGNSVLTQVSKQDVAELNIHGDLFELPAGPVAVGFGGAWRKETNVGVADPISESYLPAIPGQLGYIAGTTPVLNFNGLPTASRGARGGWAQVNAGGSRGSLNVKEVYGEALIPLLRDHSFARSFDLNGAIRYADYQYGGGVVNWKVGLSYRPFDDLRIRTTQSHDVRAPNIANLFAGLGISNAAVNDPFRRGTTGVIESNPSVLTFSRGNPILKPEIGDTFTMGMVYQPTWAEGLSLSVDYYHIIVTDALGTPGAAVILNQCLQGNQSYCQFVTRQSDPSTFGAGNTIGPITQIFNVQQNLGKTKNAGIDIEASYRLPLAKLWEGRDDVVTVRALFNYLGKNCTYNLGGASQTCSTGIVSGGAVTGTGGLSDWQGTVNLMYQKGPLTLNWQTRLINKGRINANVDEAGNPYPANIFTNPNTTLNGSVPNTVPGFVYFDLTANYKFGPERRYEAFLTVNNLLDKDPPRKLSTYFFYGAYPTNLTLYDTVGRQFTGGVRFRF